MKKAGSKVISFPKSRRSEQTGLSRKGFPVTWLGLLLMTTVGAAWAISPGTDGEVIPANNHPKSVIFEGEPQVVAQLMGAVVGSEGVPRAELRSLSALGASKRRVVVTPPLEQKEENEKLTDVSDFLAGVEQLEGEMASSGRYPAIPAKEAGVKKAGYRTTGERFKLEAETFYYDSRAGFKVADSEEPEQRPYRVVGFLEAVSSGWGPWKKEEQKLATAGGRQLSGYSWLENGAVTPSWSARMYFPIDRETTGYAFRKGDGSSAYRSGEVLYDAISGTFQLKLHRKQQAAPHPLNAAKLEAQLETSGPGCELVGDAGLMSDLGFLNRPEDEAKVVHLSSPVRLPLSADGALDGLVLSTFSHHQRALKGGEYRAPQESQSSASVVGRMNVIDKLGQVHEVRLRGGRASDYDWVVGQLCPVVEEREVAQSEAYEGALERDTKSTIIAGQ
jgi:hypothetical protein